MCVCSVTAERICPLLGCLGDPEFGSIHYFSLLFLCSNKHKREGKTIWEWSQKIVKIWSEKHQRMNLTSKHYNIAAWTGVLLDGHFVEMEKSKNLVVIIMQGITNSEV